MTTKAIKSACTEYSAKKMLEQYELACKSNYKIIKEEHFKVTSNSITYNIRVIDKIYSCDCSFYLQNQMQCRHMFYINANYFMKANHFDETVVAPRWKKIFDASSINVIQNQDFPAIKIPIIDSVETLANNDATNISAFSEKLRFLQNLANIASRHLKIVITNGVF